MKQNSATPPPATKRPFKKQHGPTAEPNWLSRNPLIAGLVGGATVLGAIVFALVLVAVVSLFLRANANAATKAQQEQANMKTEQELRNNAQQNQEDLLNQIRQGAKK